MVLTEEQARTKWCPFARVGNEAGCNRNGDSPSGFTPNCVASDCMVWVGETVDDPKFASADVFDAAPQVSTGRGWCGLAGRF